MTPEVRLAVDQIIKQFPRQQVVVAEDQTGGACVIVDGEPLGPPYEQADTWIGFHITDQCPYADTYPHYVRAELTRKDGKPLDEAMTVNLRFDPSWLRYGHESKRVPFSRTVGGRIEVDVTTTNQIVGLSFGPELTLPKGPVRPYLNAAFSGLLFWTTSSVRGIDSDDEEIARMTNHRDWTRAWVFGTGVKVPLGGRDSNFKLDFGVRYHNGSEASYLREGSIRDNPDGSITITPLTNETPFLMYSVGFNYRFPHGS